MGFQVGQTLAGRTRPLHGVSSSTLSSISGGMLNGVWGGIFLCAAFSQGVWAQVDDGLRTARPDAVMELDTVTVHGRSEPEGASGKLPQHVRGATKTDTRLLDTPQSVSVITQAQLRDSAPTAISQALAYTPGVYAAPGGGNDRSRYDFFSLRGQSFNGALFVDGMRGSFGVGNISLPQFDPWLLERVEVLRGPASSLYGQSLPGGMVNALGKRPDGRTRGEVAAAVGSHQRRELRADAQGRSADGRLDWRVAGLARKAGNQIEHVHEQRQALAPSLRWNMAPHTSLTLLASHQRDPQGGYYHGALPLQGTLYPLEDGSLIGRQFFVGDPAFDRFKRRQSTAGYDFEHRFASGWQLRHKLMHIGSRADMRAMSALALRPPLTLERSAMQAASRTRAVMSDTTLQRHWQAAGVQHHLLLGLDAMRSRIHQRLGMNMAGLPAIDVRNPVYGLTFAAPDSPASAMLWSLTQEKASQIGLYAQDQIRHGAWQWTVGGRYDLARTSSVRDSLLMGSLPTGASSRQRDKAFSGRAAVAYALQPDLNVYLGYASGFMPQTGLDAFGRGYRPLKSGQWEAGVKYAPADRGISLAAAVFDMRQKNVLTPDPDPSHICTGLTGPGSCMAQSGKLRTRGLEIEARAELGSGSFVQASMSWLDARVTASNGPDLNKRPVNTPRRMAAVWAQHALHPQWHAGFGVRHVGASHADVPNTVRVPSYTVLDAALHYRITPSAALALRASNLADKRFVTCASASYCNWGQGRSLHAEFNYQW